MVADAATSQQSGGNWQLEGSSAEAYERYLVPRLFTAWADRLIETAEPNPGDRVLDAACGTGIVSRRVASRVGPDGNVVGLDLNEGMLQIARSASAGIEPEISWQQGNLAELPFDDGSFDVVFCQQGLQFVPDAGAALDEMRRVLVPGGRIAVNICRSVSYAPTYRVLVELLGRHVGEKAATMMASPFSEWDTETVRQHLTRAGFKRPRIRVEYLAGRFPSPSEYLWQEAASSPLADEIAGLDDANREALAEDVNNALAEFADDDGIACPIAVYFATAGR